MQIPLLRCHGTLKFNQTEPHDYLIGLLLAFRKKQENILHRFVGLVMDRCIYVHGQGFDYYCSILDCDVEDIIDGLTQHLIDEVIYFKTMPICSLTIRIIDHGPVEVERLFDEQKAICVVIAQKSPYDFNPFVSLEGVQIKEHANVLIIKNSLAALDESITVIVTLLLLTLLLQLQGEDFLNCE